MIARKFKRTDKPDLKKWLARHQMPIELAQDLPAFGYLVEDVKGKIAAGFIRRMEACDVGLVDSYITNPEEAAWVRNEALTLLTTTLLENSKREGFKKLLFSSKDVSILKRALLHGFEQLSHVMMTKVL